MIEEVLALCIEVGDCLEWQGPMGSGRNSACPIFRKYNGKRTQNFQVTRLIWESRNGPIPPGKIVYRTCCNDRCVGCGKLGVRGDAQRHWGRMGALDGSPARIASAIRSSRTRVTNKCTEEKASEIRGLILAGMTSEAVAKATGMTLHIVKNIRRGRCWNHMVPGASVFDWRP